MLADEMNFSILFNLKAEKILKGIVSVGLIEPLSQGCLRSATGSIIKRKNEKSNKNCGTLTHSSKSALL